MNQEKRRFQVRSRWLAIAVIIATVVASGLLSLQGVRQEKLDSALYEAVSSGDLKSTRALLKRGANPNMRWDSRPDLNEPIYIYHVRIGFPPPDDTLETPLGEAIEWKRSDMAQVLLDGGANVNLQTAQSWGDSEPRLPPLIAAAQLGDKRMVELLLARGANIKAKSSWGTTALSEAKRCRHPAIVVLLQRAGAKE